MKVTIKLRYQPHSARKLRPFTKLFAGKPLAQSIDISSVMSQNSAQIINKALKMAKAAATSKELDEQKLIISEVFATEGPRIKRIRANARGRTNKYQKQMSHVTVSVIEKEQPAAKTQKPKTKVKSKKSTKEEKA